MRRWWREIYADHTGGSRHEESLRRFPALRLAQIHVRSLLGTRGGSLYGLGRPAPPPCRDSRCGGWIDSGDLERRDTRQE